MKPLPMYRLLRLFSLAMVVVWSAAACDDSSDGNVEDDGHGLPEYEGWELVWYDQFEDSTVNRFLWNVLNREHSYNNELQYYVPEDVYIENRCLRIRSQKRPYGSKEYTSGQVHTQNKHSWTYGRFVVRARLPRGQGMWPAHWMLPQDSSWPPEIDIMEFLGHDPHTIYMTNHWGEHRNGWHPSRGGSHTSSIDYTENFHTFAVEWEPGIIKWFIDDTLRFISSEGVPGKPFFIILNTAVGGDWPGNPNETTVFPQYHDIDYVAVYQRP
ncbi:MAG: family 16 glycosylhydrolase [Candidatus Neomarinimicrobiota bacterium]